MSSNKPFASGPIALLAMGTAFLVAVVAVIGIALGMATGAFSHRQSVAADVIATGSQIRAGAPVKFRQVTVGTVDAIVTPGSAASSTSRLALKIDKDRLPGIPANVTARIAPSSLFGENVVELVPPASASSATLRPGSTVRADRSPEAIQLTTMFAALKRMVDVLQPAKLDSVLATLAGVLDGRGPQLGRMIGQLNTQLRMLATNMPLISSDVVAVTHVVSGLSAATPALLSSVRDTVVVTRAVLQHREQLSHLITGAGGLTSEVNRFLVTNGSGITCAANVAAGLLAVLHADLGTFGIGIGNGTTALDHFITTFGQGPWGRVSVEVNSTVSKGLVAPPPYGPSDLTHYPGSPGPRCGEVTR
ncbi:MAG TPA: MCE family protein [Nocardioides sp.]|nr:MCE family protein [Nocardioides sp.]